MSGSRIEKALKEAKVLPVSRKVALEALRLADELIRDGKERSLASARTRAARTVAARHKTMPGPIFVAINRLVAEQAAANRAADRIEIKNEVALGSGELRAVDTRPGARVADRGGAVGPAPDLEWHDKHD